MHHFLQIVSHQQSEEARLERLKEWRSIIETHCEQMKHETSSPVHTPLTEEASERMALLTEIPMEQVFTNSAIPVQPCPKRARQETEVEEE